MISDDSFRASNVEKAGITVKSPKTPTKTIEACPIDPILVAIK